MERAGFETKRVTCSVYSTAWAECVLSRSGTAYAVMRCLTTPQACLRTNVIDGMVKAGRKGAAQQVRLLQADH